MEGRPRSTGNALILTVGLLNCLKFQSFKAWVTQRKTWGAKTYVNCPKDRILQTRTCREPKESKENIRDVLSVMVWGSHHWVQQLPVQPLVTWPSVVPENLRWDDSPKSSAESLLWLGPSSLLHTARAGAWADHHPWQVLHAREDGAGAAHGAGTHPAARAAGGARARPSLAAKHYVDLHKGPMCSTFLI